MGFEVEETACTPTSAVVGFEIEETGAGTAGAAGPGGIEGTAADGAGTASPGEGPGLSLAQVTVILCPHIDGLCCKMAKASCATLALLKPTKQDCIVASAPLCHILMDTGVV